MQLKSYFNDPFFIAGIMLYEAEGSKGKVCRFSNSDYRLIFLFIKFIKKYFKQAEIKLVLYIHNTREKDLERIQSFWHKKLNAKVGYVYWKKNIVTKRRENPDYMGQLVVETKREKYMSEKLLAISDIILKSYISK